MIVPSVDIEKGHAVQLRGGVMPTLDLGDPLALARRYLRVGEIAVVDLDAARGLGDNRELVESIVRLGPCRVGGGIRSREDALRFLDLGATSVMIGTKAEPELRATDSLEHRAACIYSERLAALEDPTSLFAPTAST